MKDALRQLVRHPGQHLSTLLVVLVASGFGATLVGGTSLLTKIVDPDGTAGSTTKVMLILVSMCFFTIALFVSALVVVNTFSIVVAGRTGELAMLRLIGAKASALRRSVACEGLLVGLVGSVVGLGLGAWATFGMASYAEAHEQGTGLTSAAGDPSMLVPAVIVMLTAWIAAWAGARPVLTVSPIEATRRSAEPALKQLRKRPWTLALSLVLMVFGALFLALCIMLGFTTPLAVLLGLVGGVLSFTGLAVGSAWVMPMFFRLAGLVVGHGVAGTMAVGNSRRYPLRSARTSMGMVVGIILIVMFGTIGSTMKAALGRALANSGFSAAELAMMNRGLDNMVLFIMGMVGFSVIIAAIGVANNMKAAIMQRRREIGMLRMVGLSVRQMWAMVFGETAQLTISAAIVGIPLGMFYGWAATFSLFASFQKIGPFGVTPPWGVLAAVVVGCAVITAIATAIPARQTAKLSPVQALAVS